MLQSILSNISIVLLMHLVMSMLLNMRKELSERTIQLAMILLVSSSVIVMFYLPINFDGYKLDMRFIPLVFLAYIWGWKYALPTLVIASLWRLVMGGDGAIPGIIFGMVGPTLLALIFHSRSKLHGRYIEKLLLITLCWFVSDFPIIFIMPNGYEIFKDISFIRSSTFIITAVILYTFIVLERQRSTLNEQLQRLAREDSLTKLLNKRGFYEIINEKVKNKQSKHYMAMMDIDHFKHLNDTYGHIIGDHVLVQVAKILKQYGNKDLKIGRYGGEEFIIYIGNLSFEQAKQTLEDIRQEIKNSGFRFEQGKINVTVSIGLAELEPHSPILQTVNQADKYLYAAKKNGRDRVVTSQDLSIVKYS